MILTVLVTPANVQDRDGGQLLIEQTKVVLSRLRAIYADMAYNGSLVEFCQDIGWDLKLVKRPQGSGFVVQAKRWVIERTFAWLIRNRRLIADYETKTVTTEAWIQLAMIRLMLRRLG